MEYVVQPLASVRCVMRRIYVLALLFFSIAFRFVSPPSVLACEVPVALQDATMWWLPARADGFFSCPFIQFKFFSIAFRFVSPPPVLACEVAVALQHEIVWLPARADRFCSAHLSVC